MFALPEYPSINHIESGLREDKAQKALRTLYITGLEESQQESKQTTGLCCDRVSCVVPVTCPYTFRSIFVHFFTLCACSALRRKISRDDLVKALRPIAEAPAADGPCGCTGQRP